MRSLLLAVAATLLLAAPAAAAPTWLPATNLTGESADQSLSAIAVAPDGTTVVVWSRSAPGGSVIEAARRPPGQSFGAPIALTTAAEMGTTPAVGIDGAANATVTWAQAGGVVRVARLPAGAGSFEPAETVSGASTTADNPVVGVGAGGTAVVVFEDSSGGSRIQRAAVRDSAAGPFSAATTISGTFADFQTGSFGAPSTDVAVDAAGNAAVTWAAVVDAGPPARFEVQATFRAAGGSFPPTGESPTPATAPISETGPSVAIAPGGRVTLAWSHDPNIGTLFDELILYSDRPVGGTYSAGVPANLPGERASLPDLAAANDGSVIGAWSAGVGSDLKVQSAVRPPGGAFGGHTNLSAPGMGFTLPSVAVNGAGVALVMWADFSADGIFAVQRAANGQFSGVLTAASSAGQPPGDQFNFYNPHAAVDDEGNAAAVWLFDHFRGGTSFYRIQSAALDAAPPTLSATVPPNGTAGRAVGMAAAAVDRLTPVSIQWAFGDGGTASGGAVSHAFGSPGAFNVTVTATDSVGNATSTTRPVLVAAARPKRITSPVRVAWAVSKRRLYLLRMSVNRLPKGAKAELRCARRKSGRKCPFKRKSSKRIRKNAITLFKQIKVSKVVGKKKRTFRAGQRVVLRITAPGYVGKAVRYDLRKSKIPAGKTFCMRVGSSKLRKRC